MNNYILKDENAIYYECGYSSDNAIYLRLGSEAFFLTDGRYTQEAKAQAKNCEVIESHNLLKSARQLLRKERIRTLAYDPKEWDVQSLEFLQKTQTHFAPRKQLSWQKRIIKSPGEIELLRKAVELGAQAFESFAQQAQAGMDEYELNFLAKKALSHTGRYDLSFDPIVALDAEASKPHARPTEQRLEEGRLLLMDAGLKYKRYCSDRTRTARFGRGLEFSMEQRFSPVVQKAYDTVRKAHDQAIEKARSGMKASEVDALARGVIEKAGFGEYFIHSTGHGVGLDIHEMPFISSRSDTIIEDGMVYTVEPGIYLPGEFGIRIEDMVVMQNGRAEVL